MSSDVGRAEATRSALLAAGKDVLLGGDFSMGAVARRAGVSRQAVYLHFEDRFALLDAIVQDAVASSGGPRLRRSDDAPDGSAALSALLEALVDLVANHGAFDRAVRAILASDAELAERWAARRGRSAGVRRVAERLAAEGLLRPDVSPDAANAALQAFTATDFLLGVLAHTSVCDATALVERAVRAALLRPNADA